jgi:hypothetical protein
MFQHSYAITDLTPASADSLQPLTRIIGMKHDEATRAVLTVGHGRGFVVEHKIRQGTERLVITAARCLPDFTPRNSFAYTEERTYKTLLGPLGADATVWAECLFVDPISDIAVLGEPDSQLLGDECEAYRKLVDGAATLRIVDAPEDGSAMMLSIDQRWLPCRVWHYDGPLWTSDAKTVIGMSGSPIITEDDLAIGVVCTGLEMMDLMQNHRITQEPFSDGPHARLMRSLPAWILAAAVA